MAGKYWAAEHDLRKTRGRGMATPHQEDSFKARFDRIYYSNLTTTPLPAAATASRKPKNCPEEPPNCPEVHGDEAGPGSLLLRLREARVLGTFPAPPPASAAASSLRSIKEYEASSKNSAQGATQSATRLNFVLPNEWHPSDHLPLVCDFEVVL